MSKCSISTLTSVCGSTEGRRKYDLRSEVSRALIRFKHQQDPNWRFMPRRDIISKITQDYLNKVLPCYGITELTIAPLVSRWELCEYLQCMPPPQTKDSKTGRHLRSIPVFWLPKKPNYCNGQIAKTYTGKTAEFVKQYEICEAHHKRYEDHHPDGVGWAGGVAASFECFMDVLNSIMRTSNSPQQAFKTTLEVLKGEKFENIHADGIYYGALHCFIRGIASFDALKESGQWRRRSERQVICDHFHFLQGLPPPFLIMSYKYETNLHQACIEAEMRRFRKPSKPARHHDWTKFTSKMVYYYTWYWGVYQQMSPVVRHRAMSECENLLLETAFPEGVDSYPTMFSNVLRSSAASILDDSALIPTIRQTTSTVEAKVDEALNEIKKTAREERESLVGAAEQLVAQFKDALVNKSDEILTKLVDHSNVLFGRMENLADPISSSLSMLSGLVKQVVDQFQGLTKVFGIGKIEFSVSTLIDCLKYYLIYINTPSTPIKTVCIIMILNSFGLLKQSYEWLLQFWSWLSPKVSLNGEDVPAHTTSMFDWLSDSFANFVHAACALFASLVKGTALCREQFWSLVKQTSECMKSFHFISAGLNGIGKICEFFSKLFSKVINWIKEHLLGHTPEVVEISKEVSKVIIKARYLSSESGIAAIRASRNIREQAAHLLPTWTSLSERVRHNRAYRNLAIDLDKIHRQVKDVADLVTRLKAMSDFQPTMFHVQLVGRPGIGKSTLTKNLAYSLSSTLWPEDSDAKIYSWNPSLDHFDGYAGQKIMLADDLFRINEPTHLTNLIGVITNTPVILPMANLTDKGIQLTSEVLISSTNTPYPVGKDILCTEALHRRRHMLAEVLIDDRVLDRATGQFSMALFREVYPGQDPEKFPHLTFNLLRPVPDEVSGSCLNKEGAELFDHFSSYAQKLKEANMRIISQTSDRKETLDPEFYFSEDRRPPEGIQLPTTGWSYHEFLANCVVRFRTFRGMESTYTTRRRYAHVERCLVEVDELIDQQDHIRDGIPLPITELVRDKIYEAQFPYSTEDELGRKIAEGIAVAPELENISLDDLVDSILGSETNGDSGVETSDDADEEDLRRLRILGQRGRRQETQAERNFSPAVEINGVNLIPVRSGATMFEEIQEYGFIDENSEMPLLLQRYRAMLEMSIIRSRKVREDPELDQEVREAAEAAPYGPGVTTRRRNHGAHWRILWSMFRSKYINEVQFVKFVQNFVYGSNAVIPDHEAFPLEQRGTTFPHSLFFLHHLEKHNGQWYFNVNWLWNDSCCYEYKEVRLNAKGTNEKFRVKLDPGTLFTHFYPFRIFCTEFEQLTCEQQDVLVEDSKWRSLYFGTYTWSAMRKQCESYLGKSFYFALEVISSPFKFVYEKYPQICTVYFHACVLNIVIQLMTSGAKVILGSAMEKYKKIMASESEDEETSKYLHRGQKSNLIYRGAFTSESNQNMEQLSDTLLRRNIREITICQDEQGHTVQAFICRQFIVLNKHAFRNIDLSTGFVVSIAMPGTEETLNFALNESNLYQDPEGDLAILYSSKLPCARDITDLLIQSKEYGYQMPRRLFFLSRFKGQPLVEQHTNPLRASGLVLRAHDREMSMKDGILVEGLTMVGKSGSLVVACGPQGEPKILGVQAWQLNAIKDPMIAVQVVTKEKFEELQRKVMIQAKEKPIFRIDEPVTTEITSGARFAFTSLDVNQVYAQSDRVVGVVASSQFVKSPISSSLDRAGHTSLRVPAVLRASDPALYHRGRVHPLTNSLGKYFRGSVQAFAPGLLDYCAGAITQWISAKLDKRTFRRLRFSEIVCGTREDGSNPMNLKSSPGIPFIFDKDRTGKGKKSYLSISEEGELDYVDQEFARGYKKFGETLRQGLLPYSLAYDFPKDELRPIEKALGSEKSPPKTRTVTCMNVYYVMLWRELTLDFWAAMHRAADGSFPFCPGINPEGPEWSTAYHYLSRFKNAVDFDVSNWDGYLPPELFEASLNIVMEFCAPKIDSPERLALRAIALEVMNCYIQYSDLIYQKHRGMVSGFPGTAEMNSLSHWLLIFYIYMLLTQNSMELHSLEAFNRNVSVLVYGDDIIITFSDLVYELFNGKTIAQVYTDIGYPVTSASKTGEILDRRPLSECTFLKSGWKELLPMYYIRVMDMSVAYDLIYWVRAKQDPTEQFLSNCVDALHVVFGHGKLEFNKFLTLLNSALREQRLPPILYTYRDFYEDYLNRYLRDLSY